VEAGQRFEVKKGVVALIFVGNDWPEDHHDIHVMNQEGESWPLGDCPRE